MIWLICQYLFQSKINKQWLFIIFKFGPGLLVPIKIKFLTNITIWISYYKSYFFKTTKIWNKTGLIFFRVCHTEQDNLDLKTPRTAFNLTEPSNPKKQSIKTYKIVIFFMILFLSLMVGSYMSKNRADHIQVSISSTFLRTNFSCERCFTSFF